MRWSWRAAITCGAEGTACHRTRLIRADVAAAPCCRLYRAHRHQHADFRLRHLAADLLRPGGHHADALVRLYGDDLAGGTDRLRHWLVFSRSRRSPPDHHRRLHRDNTVRRALSLHEGADADRRDGLLSVAGHI